MKIDEKRKSAILDSILKPGAAHTEDLPETDDFISKKHETIDKLELSTQKSMIDRPQKRAESTSMSLKEHKNLKFIDKVELSTKNKPHIMTKNKEKTATIISQDRIDALLKTLESETYNGRFEFVAKSAIKSQLLDIVI
jgi:hypothetical protein